MLSSSNGLGTLAFTQQNAGSNPADSTKFISTPLTREMNTRIAQIEPCAGFFHNIQNNGGWVAGGFARYVFGLSTDIPYGDIDIFCESSDSFECIIDKYVTDPKGYLSGKVKHDEERTLDYIKKNVRIIDAWYDQNGSWGPNLKNKFQFICNENLAEPLDILKEFDISVCHCYIDFYNGTINYTNEFIEDELDRNFRIINVNKETNISHIAHRMHTYLDKGYKLYFSEVVKFDEALRLCVAEVNTLLQYGNKFSFLINNPEYYHTEKEFKKLINLLNMLQLPENMLGA